MRFWQCSALPKQAQHDRYVQSADAAGQKVLSYGSDQRRTRRRTKRTEHRYCLTEIRSLGPEFQGPGQPCRISASSAVMKLSRSDARSTSLKVLPVNSAMCLL